MLASLDPHTLGLAVSVVLFTIAILAVFYLLTTRSYPGSECWAVSLTVLAFAFLSLQLRGRIPDIVSVLGITYGTFLSMCLFYDGLARFHGRNGGIRLNPINHGMALLAAAGILLHYAFAGAAANGRVLLFHGFQFFISLRMLAMIAQARSPSQRVPYAMLSTVFLMVACVSLTRIYLILNAPQITSLVQEDLGIRMMMLINIVLVIVLWFSVLLITHMRIERELEEARSKAEFAARTDGLTGLKNRHHFEAEIRREIERASRYGHPVSLVMFDIDHFKHVNDQHGHLVGDEILVELARRVSTVTRASDLLCRWGGEEFVLLMPATDDNALKAAETLRRHIEQHAFPQVGKITISAGLAQLRPGDDPASWMRRADNALYRAKSRGRNRVEKEASDFTSALPLALQWVHGFTWGHATIDEQHRVLFDKTNRLLERCGGSDTGEVVALMESLLNETERHFRYEEGMLKKASYPRLAEHGAEHARLCREGRLLLEEFRCGRVASGVLSHFAVSDLILGHISGEDLEYVSHIG
ncbi:MAG TPA: diguanylate cyclase [Noviherbaspirillum sp.]|uniref:diguanylate cyclase n=1 Tax=Noviherbaspirillum sp. TaxID=1926288 RepID=UPI002B488D4A|nr:diguanylate cyclase [Noviherbaspirillum sp.]HJV86415.1 diguanylate cyclase [Noviherbaspirillum sp.]